MEGRAGYVHVSTSVGQILWEAEHQGEKIVVNLMLYILNIWCSVQADAQYELFSIIMNVAIWHSKHGAQLAASDE